MQGDSVGGGGVDSRQLPPTISAHAQNLLISIHDGASKSNTTSTRPGGGQATALQYSVCIDQRAEYYNALIFLL